MHHEAEMTNIAPKLCDLFRARYAAVLSMLTAILCLCRPPLEYIKPFPKANYKKRGLEALNDKNLPKIEEIFEDPEEQPADSEMAEEKKVNGGSIVQGTVSHSGVRMLKHKRERKMIQKRVKMLTHMKNIKQLQK